MHKSWLTQVSAQAYMDWTSWYYFMYARQIIRFLKFLNSPPWLSLEFPADWRFCWFGGPLNTKKYPVKNDHQYLPNDTGIMLLFFLFLSTLGGERVDYSIGNSTFALLLYDYSQTTVNFCKAINISLQFKGFQESQIVRLKSISVSKFRI